MSDSKSWSMDRLAASNLLANLKVETTPEMLEIAAEHFARHREHSLEWGAKRAHSYVVQKLEAVSSHYFAYRSEDWADGFRAAEQEIVTISPEEALELGRDKARTKGQVLRAMMRQARRR